jgi:hypothetical protein
MSLFRSFNNNSFHENATVLFVSSRSQRYGFVQCLSKPGLAAVAGNTVNDLR